MMKIDKRHIAALCLLMAGISATAQEVGLYMGYDQWLPKGNHVDNLRLVKSADGTWQADRPLQWKDAETPAHFALYAPFDPNVTNAEEYVFDIPEDQSSDEAFRKADFLVGGNTWVYPQDANANLNMTLHHAFAKIVIKIAAGGDISAEELRASPPVVRLRNILIQANVNIVGQRAWSNSVQGTVIPHPVDDLTCEAIVVPQWFGWGGMALAVAWNNTAYTYPLRDFGVEGNRQYTFTVTINKKGKGGISIGIGGWDDSGKDYGGTVN